MRHLNGIPCRNFLYFVSFCFYLKNKDNCFISLPLDTLKVTFKKENAGNLFSIVRIIIRSFVTGFTQGLFTQIRLTDYCQEVEHNLLNTEHQQDVLNLTRESFVHLKTHGYLLSLLGDKKISTSCSGVKNYVR